VTDKGLLATVAEYVLVYWVDPHKNVSHSIQKSYLVYIMCYVVSNIVKYYLTNSNKYGIIVVLRRKTLSQFLSKYNIKTK
jgi:hypothetical protein